MNEIKIKCPAKINLDLKIIDKRSDGFHNIISTMQTINLYDFLNVNVQNINSENQIIINGNSQDIPYDQSNLVYKAAKLFIDTYKINNKKIEIYIEKNIPIAAGLAGGSTDAAGTLFALDKIFNCDSDLDELCAILGSDLNVCLHGGRLLAQGRGEIIHPLTFENFNLSLIKPLKLGISAKEAYSKFASKIKDKSRDKYKNDLEWAIIDDYEQLLYIKQKYPQSMMTGSGSTYFVIEQNFCQEEGYWVKNGLKSVNSGVEIIRNRR